MRKLLLTIAVAVCTIVSVTNQPMVAQEAAAEPITCEWQLSGETVADFQATIVPSRPFDRSTPENTVQSFLAVAGGKLASAESMHSVDLAIQRIVSGELSDVISVAITENLKEALEGPPAAGRSPWSLWTGNWVLERLQKPEGDKGEDDLRSIQREDGDTAAPFAWREGEVQIVARHDDEYRDSRSRSEPRFAFLCKQADDSQVWSIAGMCKWGLVVPTFRIRLPSNPDRLDFFQYGWNGYSPVAGSPLLTETHERPEVAPKLDTKEELVTWYLDELVPRGMELRTRLLQRVFAAWRECVGSFLLPSWLAELDAARSAAQESAPSRIEFEIVEYRDEPVSVLVRKHDYFKSQWLFEVTSSDGAWRISAVKRRFTATRVRDGKEVETLRDVKDFWSAAPDERLTAYNLPIFLR